MSSFDEIPEHLRGIEARLEFIMWLQQMPLSFRDRLRIYFAWIDFHQVSYTTTELNEIGNGAI